MKKSELKSLLKPLVKECISEVLIEEGVLSNIVSEVVTGMQGGIIAEARAPAPTAPLVTSDNVGKIREQKKKLMSAIGTDAYNGVNLFEDTTPMSTAHSPETPGGSVDLGNPRDSGVDISSLVGNASHIWQAMK
tara:strand:- start:89 stop:490 length:402 start_codon:yes stop_codon:yes gene_type:complete